MHRGNERAAISPPCRAISRPECARPPDRQRPATSPPAHGRHPRQRAPAATSPPDYECNQSESSATTPRPANRAHCRSPRDRRRRAGRVSTTAHSPRQPAATATAWRPQREVADRARPGPTGSQPGGSPPHRRDLAPSARLVRLRSRGAGPSRPWTPTARRRGGRRCPSSCACIGTKPPARSRGRALQRRRAGRPGPRFVEVQRARAGSALQVSPDPGRARGGADPPRFIGRAGRRRRAGPRARGSASTPARFACSRAIARRRGRGCSERLCALRGGPGRSAVISL